MPGAFHRPYPPPDKFRKAVVPGLALTSQRTEMDKTIEEKIVFFGCPLDSDEREESIRERHAGRVWNGWSDDPFEMVMRFVRREVDARLWEEKGSIEVPPWLRPIPPEGARNALVEHFVEFIDGDGCRDYADVVRVFIEDYISPHVPCMIGVDHSLTGGAFAGLAKKYKPEAVSLIVVDSHVDAIPTSVIPGVVEYDMATNPDTVYSPDDPFLKNRTESYNASSFIYHLLQEEVVEPQNVFLIGVSDFPPKHAFRIKDERIKRYVGQYTSLKRKGVKIITKSDLQLNPARLKDLHRLVKTPHVYISIDMDIGAGNALTGVRFQNYKGLNETQIYRIAKHLRDIMDRGFHLAGMDVTEFDVRKAGHGEDRTYLIAANLIKTICFGVD